MKIEFLAKNYEVKEKLKDIIAKKISRLEKFFADAVTIKVALKKAAALEIMELTILIDGMVLRSEVTSGNMYENIDAALAKLEKQIIKHRDKITDKSKKVSLKELERNFVREIHALDAQEVVRTKRFALSPMSVEDAIGEIELTDHSFYVFLNKATKRVSVLYRRNDGKYGLIETIV